MVASRTPAVAEGTVGGDGVRAPHRLPGRPAARTGSCRCPTTSTRCSASTSPTWARSAPTACCTPPPTCTAPTCAASATASRGRRVAVVGAGVVGAADRPVRRASTAPRRWSWSTRRRPAARSPRRSALEALDPDGRRPGRGAQDPLAARARRPRRRRGVPVPRAGRRAARWRCACCARRAPSIDLAFYQAGADEVRLGEEFHHNGLSAALRADRPGAARAGARRGTGSACPRRRSTCCAAYGDGDPQAPGLRGRAVRRGAGRARPTWPPAAGRSCRWCCRVTTVPIATGAGYRCRAMGVSQRLKNRFRRFLQRPGTTVDLAPLREAAAGDRGARGRARGARRRGADRARPARPSRLRRDLRRRPRGRPPRRSASGRTTCSCSARWRCSPATSPRWPPVRARRWPRPSPPTGTSGSGNGPVHVLTVNDYLARRDAEWMAPVYDAARAHRRLGHRGVHAARSGARRTAATSPTSRSARPASTTCATSSSPTSTTGCSASWPPRSSTRPTRS